MKRITGAVDTKTEINKRNKLVRKTVYGDSSNTVTGTISTLWDQNTNTVFEQGEYIFLAFRITGTKGGTAGKVEWVITNTGTSTVTISSNTNTAKIYEYVQASAAYEASFTLGVNFGVGGTLGLKLEGTSVGSNLTSVSAFADGVW